MPLHLKALRQRNFDLYTSALRCIAASDRAGLQRLGVAPADIPYLLQLSPAAVLALADQGLALQTCLYRMTGRRSEDALTTTLIEHGAPRQLMAQQFGMSTRRYTAERARLGLKGTTGRPNLNALDAAAEHRIWRLWVLLANPRQPSRLRRADHWLLLALEIPQPLRSAWALIQRWARDAEARAALAGDRARFSPARQAQAEQQLRDKHGLSAAAEAPDDEPDGAVTERTLQPCVTLLAA